MHLCRCLKWGSILLKVTDVRPAVVLICVLVRNFVWFRSSFPWSWCFQWVCGWVFVPFQCWGLLPNIVILSCLCSFGGLLVVFRCDRLLVFQVGNITQVPSFHILRRRCFDHSAASIDTQLHCFFSLSSPVAGLNLGLYREPSSFIVDTRRSARALWHNTSVVAPMKHKDNRAHVGKHFLRLFFSCLIGPGGTPLKYTAVLSGRVSLFFIPAKRLRGQSAILFLISFGSAADPDLETSVHFIGII